MKLILCFALAGMLFSTTLLRADDWKTTDGKVYQNVTVVKSEPDAVTILHQDGGARVPLATLPPDLQKQFHYDPVTAKVAADARAKAEIENAKALQAEMDRVNQQQQAALIAQNPNGSEIPTGPTLADTSTTMTAAGLPDAQHYTMGQLVDTSIKLRWDHPYGDGHYSTGALFSPNQHLTPDPDPNHHTMGDLFSGDNLKKP